MNIPAAHKATRREWIGLELTAAISAAIVIAMAAVIVGVLRPVKAPA
jgi:hypothetical protein